MRNKAQAFCIFIFSLLVITISLQAQPIYSEVKSSHQPWNYGIRLGGSYDNTTLKQGTDYKFGWKVGLVGEKRLVYNMYFQPSLSFQDKGYSYEWTYLAKGNINTYLIEGVAGLVMKFGDERLGQGLIISVSPYFTYGVGGKTTDEDLRSDTVSNFYGRTTSESFSDNKLSRFDLGFQLGVGYDFSHKWEIGGIYYFGLQKMTNFNNYRWRGFQIHLTYFI